MHPLKLDDVPISQGLLIFLVRPDRRNHWQTQV